MKLSIIAKVKTQINICCLGGKNSDWSKCLQQQTSFYVSPALLSHLYATEDFAILIF